MTLFTSRFFFWRQFDWILITVVFILSFIGLAAMYSVDLSRGQVESFFGTQIIAFFLGVIVMIIASMQHASAYRISARLMFILAIVLLVLVLLIGVTVRGTTGWFRLAGFSFQPVEFAKVVFILFLAWWADKYKRRFYSWHFVVSSALFTFLPMILVFLQPDFGSAIIFASLWFGILIIAKTRLRYLFSVIGVGVGVLVIGWFFLFAPYQKERLLTFIQPEREPLGAGYNVTQSIIAVGAGQWIGRGLGFGSQSQLHFLPEAQTDFIFAVIGEELGFVGAVVVLALYLLLFWRLLRLALLSENDFSSFAILSVVLLFFVQTAINIGATLGLLPVTGVTLPFISAGGSSLLMNFFLIGIVQSLGRSARLQKID